MTLGQKQELFSRMYPVLILFMQACGYEVRTGDVWAKTGHRRGSFHYKKLAIDINLFKDGKYLRKTSDHAKFGKFWKAMGGTWGGDWSDGNHYSLGEGRKK